MSGFVLSPPLLFATVAPNDTARVELKRDPPLTLPLATKTSQPDPLPRADSERPPFSRQSGAQTCHSNVACNRIYTQRNDILLE